MLKIRLMRIGAKKIPFYRVVVVDERAKRTGAYVEAVGTYNPLTTPKEIKLKQDRIDHWIKQGAQMSVGFLRIIGKAPQRPPRKAKKERKKEEQPAPAPQAEQAAEAPKAEEAAAEEAPKEEAPVAETPAEEAKAEEPATEVAETPETKAGVDDSAEGTKSTEGETTEPVQNKDEGSA